MAELHAIDMEFVEDNRQSKCQSIKDYFRSAKSIFSITGENRVRREKLKDVDFTLPKDQHVATYDPLIAANYWNMTNRHHYLFRAVMSSFKNGICVNLLPVTILYLAIYYLVNILIVDRILCTPGSKTSSRLHLALAPNNMVCNTEILASWKKQESDFSRVLTFFIGFFVSWSIRNWSSQVMLLPKMDRICIGLYTTLWVDPNLNEADVKIKGQLTAKTFRMTIVRYHLLSMAMCFSRMCSDLKNSLNGPKTYNKKGLLLKREFDDLNCGTGSDSWIEKWTTPLLWVNKMVNDLTKDLKNSNCAQIKDIKDGVGKQLDGFRKDLESVYGFYEYRVPPTIINILTLAIYFFMLISAISGQHTYENEAGADKNAGITVSQQIMYIILDFPFFSLVKYLMFFAWLKTAADLTSPFGNTR